MPKGFKAVDVKRGFDTQKWAEAVAEMMESKWRERKNERHRKQAKRPAGKQ